MNPDRPDAYGVLLRVHLSQHLSRWRRSLRPRTRMRNGRWRDPCTHRRLIGKWRFLARKRMSGPFVRELSLMLLLAALVLAADLHAFAQAPASLQAHEEQLEQQFTNPRSLL